MHLVALAALPVLSIVAGQAVVALCIPPALLWHSDPSLAFSGTWIAHAHPSTASPASARIRKAVSLQFATADTINSLVSDFKLAANFLPMKNVQDRFRNG